MNDQLMEGAQLYGGPGDGEVLPVVQQFPMPTFPYLHADDGGSAFVTLHWYQLYHHPQQGTWRYVAEGMAAPVGWQKVTEQFSG